MFRAKNLICYYVVTPRSYGNKAPGSSRTLTIAKSGFSHVGGLYRAGYPVKVYALPFQNMGFLSEQLVRPNPMAEHYWHNSQ